MVVIVLYITPDSFSFIYIQSVVRLWETKTCFLLPLILFEVRNTCSQVVKTLWPTRTRSSNQKVSSDYTAVFTVVMWTLIHVSSALIKYSFNIAVLYSSISISFIYSTTCRVEHCCQLWVKSSKVQINEANAEVP